MTENAFEDSNTRIAAEKRAHRQYAPIRRRRGEVEERICRVGIIDYDGQTRTYRFGCTDLDVERLGRIEIMAYRH
jgi:hypothetical protein